MSLKTVQDLLLLGYDDGLIDEEEFCALYDVNSTSYPVFNHRQYSRFELEELSEEESLSSFRFRRADIPYLTHVLGLPDTLGEANL